MDTHGRELDWRFDPLEALRRWPADRQLLMLHSGRHDRRWARWSILAQPVGTYQFLETPWATGCQSPAPSRSRLVADVSSPPQGHSRWIGPTQHRPVNPFTHKPFDDLRQLLNTTAGNGLWIGYLGYDLGRWIERLPSGPGLAQNDRGWPIIELGYCPGYLLHDSLTKTWRACGTWAHPDPCKPIDHTYPDLANALPHHDTFTATPPRSLLTPQQYERCVAKVKGYIAAGDVFQVNLAQRFTADFSCQTPQGTRTVFEQLADISPAWYGAYLELACSEFTHGDGNEPRPSGSGPTPRGHLRRAIASTSPELFLRIDGRHVTTRPIKGTRPAWAHPDELLESEKDTAELNMIVDLMRNDLGRVCDYGSVRVTQPRTIESHPTVHHGVATIEGQLHGSKDIVDLLRATLPGGSVTGAPKIRAMQIIDELEPVRRGPYCGCLGMLSRDYAQLNISIRTMMLDPFAKRIDFSVGGGIVADSQPAAEYQETLDKAAAMLAALKSHAAVC